MGRVLDVYYRQSVQLARADAGCMDVIVMVSNKQCNLHCVDGTGLVFRVSLFSAVGPGARFLQ
jgi:hypothetical protein